jgi:hypothetical protein
VSGRRRPEGCHLTVQASGRGVRPMRRPGADSRCRRRRAVVWCAALGPPCHRHRPALEDRRRLGHRRPLAHRPGHRRRRHGHHPAPPTARRHLPLRRRHAGRIQLVVATPRLRGLVVLWWKANSAGGTGGLTGRCGCRCVRRGGRRRVGRSWAVLGPGLPRRCPVRTLRACAACRRRWARGCSGTPQPPTHFHRRHPTRRVRGQPLRCPHHPDASRRQITRPPPNPEWLTPHRAGIERVTGQLSPADSQPSKTVQATSPAGRWVIGGGGWALPNAFADATEVGLTALRPGQPATARTSTWSPPCTGRAGGGPGRVRAVLCRAADRSRLPT